MWGALSRLFVKNENPSLSVQGEINETMDKQASHQDMDTMESKQARQRASVKWILSKAFNNRVPDNLKEPFYRDHEGQEHLKPQIVVGLGNASLYCQTLSNLYSDPNYQSLNHWSILQTLTRKGVPLGEATEQPLTETVLIQTNPLRINAHMSVIEALMILYAKEVAASERVSSAIGRISGGALPKDSQHHESSLLYWVSHACAALKKRIDQEIESGATDENGVRLQSPDVPPVRDYRDLCDGVCLAFLIAYYCPKVVPWTTVRVNYLPTVEDSIYNVLLVSNFSQKHLPYSVFHMTPQDITYMRGSMKQNLVVLLADFFNLFEIHPTKCVCYPGMDQSTDSDKNNGTNEHGIAHRRGLTCQPVTPIPDLRSGLDSPTQLPSTKPPFQVTRSTSATTMRKPTPPREVPEQCGQEEGFVVHRGRTIPTLASMQEPLVPARLRQAKEKSNHDSKNDERGDNMAAGRPSNWEDARRTSYAGRRSRRNSLSEDSQLTIENFGGSQDQLNMIGRPVERERKFSNSTVNNHTEPAVAVRSSIADARGTLQIGYDNDSEPEKQDRETEKTGTMRRHPSMDNVTQRNVTHSKEKDTTDGDVTQFNRQQIQSVEDDTSKRKKSFVNIPPANPKTTTWQQQSMNFQQIDNDVDEDRSQIDDSKLSAIRMKLEEHRRHILQEKRKMEFALSRQQQKVGKAAFFQAINKQIDERVMDNESGKAHNQTDNENKDCSSSTSSNDVEKSDKPCSLQDLPDITDTRWEQHSDSKKTPDLDPSEIDQYQQSIAIMNSNLKDIQQDIHRLTNQQSQMQAQAIQAQQLLQAQQIANMIQYHGSSQNIPQQYRNMPPSNFGSTPHLSQPYNQQPMIMRPPSRDPQHQYINDQGQYITNSRECSPFMNDNGQYYGNQYVNAYPEVNQYQTYRVEQPQYREYESPPPAQPSQNQFYLHDNPPQPPPRRTWAQAPTNNQQIPLDVNAWQQNSPKIDTRTWKSPSQPSSQGFMLHQNGNDYDRNEQSYESPQHSRVHRQISQIISGDPKSHIDSNRQPISPPIDDMAPQSISFIGDDDSVDPIGNGQSKPPSMFQRPNITSVEQEQDLDLGRLNITSGKLTYRIPSPTRPSLNMNSFQDPNEEAVNEQKGFYIAFDNVQPKRPKPPLRTKRSPKKERSIDSDKQDQSEQLGRELNQERRNQDAKRNSSFSAFDNDSTINNHRYADESISNNTYKKPEPVARRQHVSDNQVSAILDRRHLEDVTNHRQSFGGNTESKALIIDDELKNLDPESVDEMERKKEKIMLLSLQRRQQQEEAKARKEIDAMQRREKEREKEDERARKREEQAARRALILEQHKYKKAVEEAEQKGITIDRNDFALIKQQMSSPAAPPKMRQQKAVSRPRPKTICVERGSIDQSEASSLSSRDKKGSNTNLTGLGRQLSSNSIRRDYYRGSTDSLAIREPTVERGRTLSRISVAKGSNLNFRGRKSNSLMNLCDTDSGLGRATPPRRAPSPGMGPSSRHLPSPSGPGSLPPGFMNKRRIFDDGSSDISAASSMMEYSGPKLYKQPATKSNRGIILNAVEFCVFPGIVNREAKQKVLEKIEKSEAKHFLVLFRDAGCQFRALYSYWPENETVIKLHGTGPTQVDEYMFDKFFKYNSGGKCFSQIHTKHLTVTIDAFTIHNSLWQGKKVNMPSKKDMALVI
ncbi:patronin isoform X7 [Bradysia coprophila]|uniref:patronin isoform X7 n=1 Tax=Bradysia coprophila TaxID=38358 RepID=UPI00187D736C|nr:patronin isoform X7 [Bradysia coprophila]